MYTIIDHLERVEPLGVTALSEYFGRLKYRGCYYVNVKVEAAKLLRSKGYSYPEIATIILGNPNKHDTIQHYCKHYSTSNEIAEETKNWQTWVHEGLYPFTLTEYQGVRTYVQKGEVKYQKFQKPILNLKKIE